MRPRLCGFVLAVALGSSGPACLDAPIFGVPSDDGRPGPSPDAGGARHDGMVRIAATQVEAGEIAPASKGKPGHGHGHDHGGPPHHEEGEGDDGEGEGDGDAGDSTGDAAPPPATVIPAFWIDVTEVTVAAYAACVAEGACSPPAADAACAAAPGDHPRGCVTFEQALRYCTFAGKRLVRAGEWTAAAAGSAGRPFPWGADPPGPALVNACGAECAPTPMYDASDGFVRTAPVGSFPRGGTPEGVLDLAGNVAEWVTSGDDAIVRGGSFEDTQVDAVASTAARRLPRDASSPPLGFRCAMDEVSLDARR